MLSLKQLDVDSYQLGQKIDCNRIWYSGMLKSLFWYCGDVCVYGYVWSYYRSTGQVNWQFSIARTQITKFMAGDIARDGRALIVRLARLLQLGTRGLWDSLSLSFYVFTTISSPEIKYELFP